MIVNLEYYLFLVTDTNNKTYLINTKTGEVLNKESNSKIIADSINYVGAETKRQVVNWSILQSLFDTNPEYGELVDLLSPGFTSSLKTNKDRGVETFYVEVGLPKLVITIQESMIELDVKDMKVIKHPIISDSNY